MHDSKQKYWLSRPANTKIIRKDEGSGYKIYSTNKLGFRKTFGEDVERDFDVLVFGDSFAEGCCVGEGYAISDFIAKSTNSNVLNFGIAGSGPLHQLAILTELIESDLTKDLLNKKSTVVWTIYSGNDLRDLRRKSLNFSHNISKMISIKIISKILIILVLNKNDL